MLAQNPHLIPPQTLGTLKIDFFLPNGPMRTLLEPPKRIISALLTRLRLVSPAQRASSDASGKPEAKTQKSTVRLHEAQHNVILGLFRLNQVVFSAFFVILISFAAYLSISHDMPRWVAVLMGLFGVIVMALALRLRQESTRYSTRYENVAKNMQRQLAAVAKGGSLEHRLLTALRPKEHQEWDAKECPSCHRSIELLEEVCQHCGHEQNETLAN